MNKFAIGCGGLLVIVLFIVFVIGLFFCGTYNRLLVVAENYPQLTATENFRGLQAQLEGTENRISVERNKFNTTVQEYNVAVRRFPTNTIAGMFGFQSRPFFNAQPGAEKAPTVNF